MKAQQDFKPGQILRFNSEIIKGLKSPTKIPSHITPLCTKQSDGWMIHLGSDYSRSTQKQMLYVYLLGYLGYHGGSSVQYIHISDLDERICYPEYYLPNCLPINKGEKFQIPLIVTGVDTKHKYMKVLNWTASKSHLTPIGSMTISNYEILPSGYFRFENGIIIPPRIGVSDLGDNSVNSPVITRQSIVYSPGKNDKRLLLI